MSDAIIHYITYLDTTIHKMGDTLYDTKCGAIHAIKMKIQDSSEGAGWQITYPATSIDNLPPMSSPMKTRVEATQIINKQRVKTSKCVQSSLDVAKVTCDACLFLNMKEDK